MRKIEVSNESYRAFKNKVLENEIIQRIEVPLVEIAIENLETIKLKNTFIPITREALTSLMEILGINKSFFTIIYSNFKNNEERSKLLNSLVKHLKNKKSNKVVILYNTVLQKISYFYPPEFKLIEDSQYFTVIEKTLDANQGSYIRNLNQDDRGQLKASIITGNEFQFGNQKDEVFVAGLNIDLNIKTLEFSFFTQRLVCSNGSRVTNKLMSKCVKSNEEVADALNFVLNKSYEIENVNEFKKRINRTYYTQASLREILMVDDNLRKLLKDFSAPLMKNMSSNHIKLEFGEDVLNNDFNHSSLRTDISLWQLVNEVTALSSKIEQFSLKIPETVNMNLQILGGDILFYKPDLIPANINQIFPEYTIEQFRIKNSRFQNLISL